jgi:hypothetical protein
MLPAGLAVVAFAGSARAQDPQPAPAASAEDASVEQAAPAPLTTRETAMWAMVGVAGLGAIAGGVFGLTALGEETRFNDNPSRQVLDRGETRALASDICFSVAAAAAVAAIVLALTDDEEPVADPSKPAVKAGGPSLVVEF